MILELEDELLVERSSFPELCPEARWRTMNVHEAISYKSKERSHKAIHVTGFIWRGADFSAEQRTKTVRTKILRLRGLKRVLV